MRYLVTQGEQTPWEIGYDNVPFFFYGVWVQGGRSIEEAGRTVGYVLDELNNFGKVDIEIGGELYQLTSVSERPRSSVGPAPLKGTV